MAAEAQSALPPQEAQGGGGEWDMTAPISADDLARAGGLGARDDIGSAVPVAADNTDFEETLMEFEDEGTEPERHEGVGYHGQRSQEEGNRVQGEENTLAGVVPPVGDEANSGISVEDGLKDPLFLEHHFTKGVPEPTE